MSYGNAATRDNTGSRQWPVLKILGRVWPWNALPNGRRAYFFDIWAGRAFATDRFRARLRADLTEVFAAQRRGEITAQVAAVLPLARVAEALRLAESGTGPARSSSHREASRHEASGRMWRMRLRARR